jgi:hypothetical protein
MPRYFFHVDDGRSSPDDEGLEMRNADEARNQAVIAAGEALRDIGGKFWHHPEWLMVVTDERDRPVCRLRFSAEV